MDPIRIRKVLDLLKQGLHLEAEARERMLADGCEGDDDLREEVEALLRLAESDVESRHDPHPPFGAKLFDVDGATWDPRLRSLARAWLEHRSGRAPD
jgi:hypothetical protein